MSQANVNSQNVLKPDVVPFFDEDSSTFSYVVKDPTRKSCAVIDPVMDFNYASGSTSFEGADAIIEHIRSNDLKLEWLIETHVHADHLSSAPYIQEKLGGKLAVGEKIMVVQETFGKVFNEGTEFKRDGSQFDHLFTDNEEYKIGNLVATALHTPGHTPACMSHVIGDAVFVGDTLFMPDAGTARADFPGGDAGMLFDSVRRIMELPQEYRVFMCHDYQPDGRELEFLSSIGEQRHENIHVKDGVSKAKFVEMREARDRTLDMPRLILPSLQVNMRAGHLPEPEDNQVVYFKTPINLFK